MNVIRVSGTTTLSNSAADFNLVVATGSYYDITAPASPADGQIYIVRNADGSATSINFTANTGQTVEGASAMSIGNTQADIFFYDSSSSMWRGVGYW